MQLGDASLYARNRIGDRGWVQAACDGPLDRCELLLLLRQVTFELFAFGLGAVAGGAPTARLRSSRSAFTSERSAFTSSLDGAGDAGARTTGGATCTGAAFGLAFAAGGAGEAGAELGAALGAGFALGAAKADADKPHTING